MKFIFKILKVISWIWIGVVLLVYSNLKTTAGTPLMVNVIFVWGIPIVIMIAVPVAFLIWRFKAEKGLRLQKLQTKEKENKINEQNEKLSEETVEKLMNLKELLSLEIITKEEFEKKKNDLLN